LGGTLISKEEFESLGRKKENLVRLYKLERISEEAFNYLMKVIEERLKEVSTKKYDETQIEVEPSRGFHFYEEYGKPTELIATSLEDFIQKLQKASLTSIGFHHKRGDFIKWISQVLKRPELARSIAELEVSGEKLRIEIIETLRKALQ